MPILNQVELYLDGEYSKEEKKEFLFKSRCICNFWEREINRLKFTTQYSRINVYVSDGKKETKVQPMKTVSFLEVIINYPFKGFTGFTETELQRHYIAILDIALSAAGDFMPVPLVESNNVLKKFENDGFQNEWVHTEKSWIRKLIDCRVVASLSLTEFKIIQQIYYKGKFVGKKLVASTLPRELVFDKYLGKLSISGSGILEYKKGQNVLTKFDLAKKKFI